MDLQTTREQGVLVVSAGGRLDSHGAGQLETVLRDAVSDDDTMLVFDLSDLTYLSSAGIRVFLGSVREMKNRGGLAAFAAVPPYPMDVLEMAGFTRVFSIHAAREEAVRACLAASGDDLNIIDELRRPSKVVEGIRITAEPGSRDPASLRVAGSLQDLLFARITPADIRRERFSDIRYSIGLGALGRDIDDALPLLGEMITLHGSMVWLPTDGHGTPDFLTPATDTGAVPIYTAYNISLAGRFHEILTCEPAEGGAFSLDDLYRAVFARSRARREYRGVVAVAIWGVIDGLRSSGIAKAPLAADAPAGGASILDPGEFDRWFDSRPDPRYAGDTLVGFGVGIDLGADHGNFDPADLGRMYYVHPQNLGSQERFLHTHGVVFRNIPWDPSRDLDRQVRRIVTEGEFVDMRHLLDTTTLRRAKVGLAYISDIEAV